MHVTILDHLPAGLLKHPAASLARYLDGPTLIHLPGRKPAPLFVSVLQHGNEISGWDSVRRLLAGRYQRDPLPRSLALFIGNITAAAEHKRHLPDQADMNRCWPGTRRSDSPFCAMLDQLTRHMRSLKPFASIDIHNNTGENPHYAAVNKIDAQRLNLATRFSRTVVYFTEPGGVQSDAFGQFCPAVTLECGLPGMRGGTDHAMAYLESVLNMDYLSEQFPQPEDLDLFKVAAVVKIPPECSFTFGSEPADLSFEAGIDKLNFSELPPGTRFARTRGNGRSLLALDTEGEDCTQNWFCEVDGSLLTQRPAMPAMLTTQADAIRQDCLCYLMERIRVQHPPGASGLPGKLPESAP
ncbi:MAG: M14 family metallopeptidase [Xanthomonadaceae bacterium]|nr:M14 family metallopeptidase [Xanthomonadaceae bacterium]